jgi:hypothetical protein
MRAALVPLLLLALLAIALYFGVERGNERTLTVQGVGIAADSLDWRPDGTELEARGHVTLSVPNLSRVTVSDADGQRSWAFGAASTGTLQADRATIDLAAGLIEAEGGIFTSSDTDPLIVEEPAMTIRFRTAEVVDPFQQARP